MAPKYNSAIFGENIGLYKYQKLTVGGKAFDMLMENNVHTYYEHFLPSNYRDSILIFSIIYLFALYTFSKRKIKPSPQVIEALCPVCKIQMEINKWKCPTCKKGFG